MKKPQVLEYSDFIKNLAKYNTEAFKLDIWYTRADSRCWSVVINPGLDNIIVTYHINRRHLHDESFDILSSDKIYHDVEPESVFDVIDLLTTNNNEQE